MSDKRWTVAVDCDGVLHSYTSGWQGADQLPDPPVDGAIQWLNDIVDHFDVVILTTRGDQPGGNEAVMAYLREHGYDGPDLLVTSHKVPALIYIDDRGYRFVGRFPMAHEIHDARPWNKPRVAAGQEETG